MLADTVGTVVSGNVKSTYDIITRFPGVDHVMDVMMTRRAKR